ncbi:MAG: AAA family ATPase [Pseudomonadota bacterium]
MRLLAIRGRNLASLAEPFEVDLDADPLRSAGLFAITGPTGAGKSTLLDAICLPLYDRLPRLGDLDRDAKIQDASGMELSLSDPRAILRHGAGEGFAEVDFIGQDRRGYRARWSLNRARGRADGKLQNASITLSELGGAMLANQKRDALAQIAAKVGLSFEQFTRSVLLAQGEFDAFLRARANERAALLERITGSAIYARLSKAAHARAAAEKAEIAAIEQRAAAHAPLSEADRADIEARLAARRQAADRSEADARRLAAVETWIRDAATLAEANRTAALEAETAAAAAREIAAAALAAVRTRKHRLRTALAELDAWLGANDAVARLEAAWPETRSELEALEATRRRRDQAGLALQRATTARKAADKAQAEAEAHRQSAAETAEAAEAAAAAKLDAWRAFDADALQRDRARWAAIEAAARAGANAAEQARAAQAQAADAKAEAVSEAARADQAKQDESQEALRLPPLRRTLELARGRLERWTAAAGQEAARLRALLEPGEPCPVCGGRDHRAAPRTETTAGAALRAALGEERQAVRDAEAAVRAAELRIAELTGAARDGRARAEAAKRRAAQAEQTRSAAARGVGEARSKLRDLGVEIADESPEANVELWVAKAEHALLGLDARLAAAHAARAASDEAAAAARAEAARRDAALEAVRTQLEARAAADREAVAAEAERSAAEEALDDHERRLAIRLDPIDPDWRNADPTAVRRRAEAAIAVLRDKRAARDRLVDQAPSLDAEIRSLEELQDAPDPAEQTPDHARKDVAEASAERFAAAGAPDRARAVAAREAAIAARARAAAAAERAAATRAAPPEAPPELSPLLAPDQPLAAAAERAAAARASAEARAREAAEARDEALAACAKDDAARAARAREDQALAMRRAEAAVWLRLDALIGAADGSKFRRFAQSLTLARLIALANQRLAELHPRYALASAGEGGLALQVIDREMADEVRGAHNLSGGERFLISLALALGLSSLSSETGVRVETLFIDEGFGALDPDSLGGAIAALEALQATGRRIGVISHVPELAERLAARIEVSPQGGGRSRIAIVSN